MAQHTKSDSESNVVVSTLLVAVLASTSALLLLSAFVVWFADVIGSLPLSLLIVGASAGASALIIYRIYLSPTLRRIREEYEIIVALARVIRGVYQSAIARLLQILS